jgi:hypothetical protein
MGRLARDLGLLAKQRPLVAEADHLPHRQRPLVVGVAS